MLQSSSGSVSLRIVLVRHGLSSFNLEHRIQGRDDLSALTGQGVEQALAIGGGHSLRLLQLTQDGLSLASHHSAMMEGLPHSINIPEDCSTARGTEHVILTTDKEATVRITATLQVVLTATDRYSSLRRWQPLLGGAHQPTS